MPSSVQELSEVQSQNVGGDENSKMAQLHAVGQCRSLVDKACARSRACRPSRRVATWHSIGLVSCGLVWCDGMGCDVM